MKEPKVRERIASFGKETGKDAGRLALKAAKFYLLFTPLGGILGMIGGYAYAAYADHGSWASAGLVLLGLPSGLLIGFFAAQIAVAMAIEDMVWDKGIIAAKGGLAEMKKLWKKRPKTP